MPEKLPPYSNVIYDLAHDYEKELGIEINPMNQFDSVYQYWKWVYTFL